MKLDKLLERLDYTVVQGSDSTEVTTLINDSRKVEEGSVFRSEERRVGKECRSRWSPYH